MYKCLSLSVALFICLAGMAQKITLVKNHRATSRIIIPAGATDLEYKSAIVLRNYFQQISGAELPIAPDTDPQAGNEILLGQVNRPEVRNLTLDSLGKDGFILRNTSNKLIIAGGSDRGVLYGVYALLEKYLGCRRYSSTASVTPERKSIVFDAIQERQVPTFSFRRIEYRDANVGDFADWNRVVNGSEWGTWCHTFEQLLPTATYAEKHPEYFSYYNNARQTSLTPSGAPIGQLCLSNPEVYDIVATNLAAMIAANPSAKYWSVSQNDNVNYCRCDGCARLDSMYAARGEQADVYATGNTRYASTGMGSMLYFINKLASRFPDKVISTLAYQYTRKPPVGIMPAANTNMMLCSIESPRDVPITTGDLPFSRDLAGWGKLTKDILVWDYVIQFRHLLAPFPNLRTLQPNLQFLRDNSVTAIFEQGNRQSGGEFAELRAYLLTKLMWNADADVNEIMNDFLNGYYGKAGPFIRQYIDLTHNKMEADKIKLTIFGTPVQAKESFLSDSLLKVYNALFDKAEKAVVKSPEALNRVRTARLPVYYAMLEIARAEKAGPRGAFMVDATGKSAPNPAIVEILHKFAAQCMLTGVTRIAEWNTVPLDYLQAYTAFLEGKPARPVVRLR